LAQRARLRQAVAQALEREKAAGHALAATLQGAMLPRLVSLLGGLHNLCATGDFFRYRTGILKIKDDRIRA
jgi:hypothetical protein